MFIDRAKIYLKAGNGGNGKVSFRREKYVPAGGPDGGDGGRGGAIVFVGDSGMHTLSDFRYKTKYRAENGADGGAANCTGRSGEDMRIRVPLGTLVYDADTERLLCDITEDGQAAAAVKGGKGGAGNQHFATPTRQAPDFAKSGDEGEERWVNIELKLIADVGLVGFPNVGKSTLLSMVSSARPKIADYHFTTLSPNLGVVDLEGEAGFVMADIPGLIEGAHEGVGLGDEFLRHIERTRLLLHLIDVAGTEGRDPISDFEIISRELKEYKIDLSGKPQIVVANKTDVLPHGEGGEAALAAFRDEIQKRGFRVLDISAATGRGVRELMYEAYHTLCELPAHGSGMPGLSGGTTVEYTLKESGEPRFTVSLEGGTYIIEGKWIKKLVTDINFGNSESMAFFQRQLVKFGVIEELERMGVKEGDPVKIYELEFDYIK
jgi:GTP-binding protein